MKKILIFIFLLLPLFGKSQIDIKKTFEFDPAIVMSPSMIPRRILEPLVNAYMTNVVDARADCRVPSLAVDVDGNPLKVTKQSIVLTSFWANYQYKHEFNPAHDHGGAFSFVIWLKIPYSWKEQKKLQQFKGTKDNQKVA